MKISSMRDKIDIVKIIENEGPVEELEPNYKTVISQIWAKKIRLLGKESLQMGMDHNIIQVNFIIRNRKDISENLYIKHENSVYNIIGFEKLKEDENYMLIATVKKQVLL